MDLSNLSPDEIQKLRQIAASLQVKLEDLLREKDPNTLLEQYQHMSFGMLNEYEGEHGNILHG